MNMPLINEILKQKLCPGLIWITLDSENNRLKNILLPKFIGKPISHV